MPISLADKRATFRKLHESGCFPIPNPFDVGSAKALAQMGALRSTTTASVTLRQAAVRSCRERR